MIRIIPIPSRSRKLWIAPTDETITDDDPLSPISYYFSKSKSQLVKAGFDPRCIIMIPVRKIR
jgi:hypothetical protein